MCRRGVERGEECKKKRGARLSMKEEGAKALSKAPNGKLLESWEMPGAG